jgi:hypothetical protein
MPLDAHWTGSLTGPRCSLDLVEGTIHASVMWLSGQQQVAVLMEPSWLIWTCDQIMHSVLQSQSSNSLVAQNHVIRIHSIIQCFRTQICEISLVNNYL